MPCSAEQLFSFLDRLGISYETTEHPAIFNAEQGRDWYDKIPGLHCKNLFLEDEKGGLWLVLMHAEKRADLKRIARQAGSPRFSFAKPDVMVEVLGVTPGTATPFALMNDTQRRVTLIVDEDVVRSETMNVHPLRNTASTTLKSSDFMKFVRALDYEPLVLSCGCEQAGNDG